MSVIILLRIFQLIDFILGWGLELESDQSTEANETHSGPERQEPKAAFILGTYVPDNIKKATLTALKRFYAFHGDY